MSKILKEKEATLDFIIKSIFSESEIESIKGNVGINNALKVLKEYLLKNKGLINYKKENPYYYTLLMSNISNNNKEYEIYKNMLLETKIKNIDIETNKPSKNNKIIIKESKEYNIDFNDSSNSLLDIILKATGITNEVTLVIKTIEKHLSIYKLNATHKAMYNNLLGDLKVFEEATNKTNKAILETNTMDTITKLISSSIKSKLENDNKVNSEKYKIADGNIAAPIFDDKEGEFIVIKNDNGDCVKLSDDIVANLVNQHSLITGLSNIIRRNLKLPLKESDNLRKLTTNKNSILYNSIMYNVRLYTNNLEKVSSTLNNYANELASEISKRISINGIKSVELQSKLEDSSTNLDAISLKLIADSLYLLSSIMTLKNCIGDTVLENDIISVELRVIRDSISSIINNLTK